MLWGADNGVRDWTALHLRLLAFLKKKIQDFRPRNAISAMGWEGGACKHKICFNVLSAKAAILGKRQGPLRVLVWVSSEAGDQSKLVNEKHCRHLRYAMLYYVAIAIPLKVKKEKKCVCVWGGGGGGERKEKEEEKEREKKKKEDKEKKNRKEKKVND